MGEYGDFKEGEEKWCMNCKEWFTESVQDHGAEYHENELWNVNYSKEKEDENETVDMSPTPNEIAKNEKYWSNYE